MAFGREGLTAESLREPEELSNMPRGAIVLSLSTAPIETGAAAALGVDGVVLRPRAGQVGLNHNSFEAFLLQFDAVSETAGALDGQRGHDHALPSPPTDLVGTAGQRQTVARLELVFETARLARQCGRRRHWLRI